MSKLASNPGRQLTEYRKKKFFFVVSTFNLISFRVSASIKDLKLLGVKQENTVPSLLNSDRAESGSDLFSVTYEKNPLDKTCGDRIIVQSRSLLIVYDAQTIVELIKLFKVQNPSTLNQ